MATYILKRKTYSINPYKLTFSDILLEFGVEFPDEIKKLAKMERRIEAKLHYWAVSAPGVNLTASPEMIYEKLSNGEKIIPALINSIGETTLLYDISAGKYRYGDTLLEDSDVLVNTVIGELQRYINMNSELVTNDRDIKGGEAEAMKQNISYYQVYLDNVCRTFGKLTPEEEQQRISSEQQQAHSGQVAQ